MGPFSHHLGVLASPEASVSPGTAVRCASTPHAGGDSPLPVASRMVCSEPMLSLGLMLLLSQTPTPPPAEPPLADVPAAAPEEDLTRYWEQQPARPFLAGHVALGGLNRLMLATGYGRPHWLWGGLQLEAMTTTEFAALYAGLELELLVVNLALGFRNTWSYGKYLPLVAPSYTENDVYANPGRPRATYQSFDFGLWGYVPVWRTLGYWEFTGSWLPFKSPEVAVFDEFLRFTISGAFGALGRLLWGVRLWGNRITVGPMVELVGATGRPMMVRVGGGLMFTLTRHLSIKLNLAAPVTSPDAMGWFTQSFAVARITWSWALGETRWGFR